VAVDASARVCAARGAANRSRGSYSAGSRVRHIRRRPLRRSPEDQGMYLATSHLENFCDFLSRKR